MKRPMIRNVFFTLISIGVFGLTKLVYSIAVGRAFGPQVLGEANLVVSTVTLLSLPLASGFSAAATKFTAEYLARNDQVKAKGVLAGTIVATVCLTLLSFVFLCKFRQNAVNRIGIANEDFYPLLAISFFYNLYVLYKGLYYGVNQVGRYLKVELFADLVFFVGLASVLLWPAKTRVLWPFLALYLVFVLVAVFDLRTWWRGAAWKATRVLESIGPYIFLAIVGNTASSGIINLGAVFTGSYLTTTDVAYYSVAFAIVAPLYFLPRAIALVSFPAISHFYGRDDLESLKSSTDHITRWLMVVMTALCGLVVVSSHELLQIMYGSAYLPATSILQIMVSGEYLVMISVPAVNLLTATRTKYMHIPTWASVAGLIVSVLLWVWWIPLYGVWGAALGYFVGTVIKQGVCMYAAYRLFPLDGRAMMRMLVAGGVSLSLALIVRQVSSTSFVALAAGALFLATFSLLVAQELKQVLLEFYDLCQRRLAWSHGHG